MVQIPEGSAKDISTTPLLLCKIKRTFIIVNFQTFKGQGSLALTNEDHIKVNSTYLNVSKIMVNNTNFPSRGTTSDVGGMISASKRKNTVSESKMEMERLT